MTNTPKKTVSNPWPHRLAVLLVCATFPLIWVGGLVTSYRAGMAVPDWPATYGYNLFLYPWQTWIIGPWDLFVEHGHRLLGAATGMVTIAFVATVWLADRRAWITWVALSALVLVIGQGLLGGLRVIQDEIALARVHACVGPGFFALTVALAVFTSDFWKTAPAQIAGKPAKDATQSGRLGRLAALTAALVYAQLVVGAHLRHLPPQWSPQAFTIVVFFHLLLAAVVAIHVVLIAVRVWRIHRSQPALVRPALGLFLLTGLQLTLGVATWVVKYSWPSWLSSFGFAAGHTVQAESLAQVLIVTAHVAVGSLILAISLMLALRSFRLISPVTHLELVPTGRWLGVPA